MEQDDLPLPFAVNEISKEGFLLSIFLGVSLADCLDGRLVAFNFHDKAINRIETQPWLTQPTNVEYVFANLLV
jgi:hypothetical protein